HGLPVCSCHRLDQGPERSRDSGPAARPARTSTKATRKGPVVRTSSPSFAKGERGGDFHGMAPMTTENMTPEQPAPPPLPAESAGPPSEQPPIPLAPPAGEAPVPSKLQWYVVKVQSNREESIREAL